MQITESTWVNERVVLEIQRFALLVSFPLSAGKLLKRAISVFVGATGFGVGFGLRVTVGFGLGVTVGFGLGVGESAATLRVVKR